MTSPDNTQPALTERSRLRIENGATSGAGTHNCIKCAGTKEPRRINSDKCAECNGVKHPAGSRTREPKVTVSRTAHTVFPEAMYLVIAEQAHQRDMTIEDYIVNGMRRVLKKDAGWVAPNLT